MAMRKKANAKCVQLTNADKYMTGQEGSDRKVYLPRRKHTPAKKTAKAKQSDRRQKKQFRAAAIYSASLSSSSTVFVSALDLVRDGGPLAYAIGTNPVHRDSARDRASATKPAEIASKRTNSSKASSTPLLISGQHTWT